MLRQFRHRAEHVGGVERAQHLDVVEIDHRPLPGFLGFWADLWAGFRAGFLLGACSGRSASSISMTGMSSRTG